MVSLFCPACSGFSEPHKSWVSTLAYILHTKAQNPTRSLTAEAQFCAEYIWPLWSAHTTNLSGCKPQWPGWEHRSITVLSSHVPFSFPVYHFSSSLHLVHSASLCSCWCSQLGVQVLLVPLGCCTAAGKSYQTAQLQC